MGSEKTDLQPSGVLPRHKKGGGITVRQEFNLGANIGDVGFQTNKRDHASKRKRPKKNLPFATPQENKGEIREGLVKGGDSAKKKGPPG